MTEGIDAALQDWEHGRDAYRHVEPPGPGASPEERMAWFSATSPIPYYDRQGNRITLLEWTALVDTPYYIGVGDVSLPRHHIRVSTVWLGIDYGGGIFNDGEPPLIFETMIFAHRDRDKGRPWSDWCQRWRTEEEARRGHQQIVSRIKSRGANAIRSPKDEREFWAFWRDVRGRLPGVAPVSTSPVSGHGRTAGAR